MVTVWQELAFGAHQAFRTIVPEPQDRIPIAWNNAIYPVACYFPFIFLAYLARRSDTYLIRLLLLPTVITCSLVAAYKYTWRIPQLNLYNWAQALFAAIVIAKSLEFALRKEGMLKIGESSPGVMKGKAKKSVGDDVYKRNGDDYEYVVAREPHPYLATWFIDAIELAHSLRGPRWKFGAGTHIPPEWRPLEKTAFLQATAGTFFKHLFILDFLESLLKLFPGVGDPSGGTIFYPTLSLPARYVVSTLIHCITGAAILSGFNMCYDLITLFAVGVCDASPSSWPPVTDDPWNADSVHRLWAKDWHQLLRHTFLIYGGYPGKWIAGDFGMLIGIFLASGLFHECAMYGMGKPLDIHATIFFGSQSLVLIGERVWRKVTGRRVGGFWGKCWVYFILFVAPQMMVDSWHRRGFGGGMVIPPMISPTRLILLPIAQRLLKRS